MQIFMAMRSLCPTVRRLSIDHAADRC
jgi:hypothetical protein